ncbi:hypothetical protein LCGC14_1143770 [marine sediment metagenome]|uniref:Uncharacterized protein n=1 Tax=marine sediment metagenome TaxID=412755 RepID=A0A0F9LXK4_9ZZZZ
MQETEIIQGLFRTGDIITVSGYWGCGKSPLLKDWALHIASGRPWCGHPVSQRPVLLLDFESKGRTFQQAWQRMCKRMNIAPPSNIQEYVANDREQPPRTLELQAACKDRSIYSRAYWLNAKLAAAPNAIIMIDPLDLMFPLRKNEAHQIVSLYWRFRETSFKYPDAAFLFVFNLRKLDRKAPIPNLLENPRGWLQETAGSLDIQNRSDVRLGLDERADGALVLNGIRRDEKMDPTLLEYDWFVDPEDGKERETGFRLVAPETITAKVAFTEDQQDVWTRLEREFSMEDVLQLMRRSAAYALVRRALSVGVLEKLPNDRYWKKGAE